MLLSTLALECFGSKAGESSLSILSKASCPNPYMAKGQRPRYTPNPRKLGGQEQRAGSRLPADTEDRAWLRTGRFARQPEMDRLALQVSYLMPSQGWVWKDCGVGRHPPPNSGTHQVVSHFPFYFL